MDPKIYAQELETFVGALERANFDPRLLLTEMAQALEEGGSLPRSELPERERDYLINHGGLGGRHAWAAEDAAIEAGALHLRFLITRLEDLRDSLSVKEVALLMDVSEEIVAQQIEASRLVAFTAAGMKRLPRWQFMPADGDAPHRPLPHLEVVAKALADDRARRSAHAQMTTPDEDLVIDEVEGAISPVVWLQRGGEPKRVVGASFGCGATKHVGRHDHRSD